MVWKLSPKIVFSTYSSPRISWVNDSNCIMISTPAIFYMGGLDIKYASPSGFPKK